MWWLLMVSKRWRDEQRTSIFKTENPPDPKTIVAIAVASILSSKEQLARTIGKYSSIVLDRIDHHGESDDDDRIIPSKVHRDKSRRHGRHLQNGECSSG